MINEAAQKGSFAIVVDVLRPIQAENPAFQQAQFLRAQRLESIGTLAHLPVNSQKE